MSLSILPGTRPAIAPNLTYPFVGVGGTGPYTYSVLTGGIGGMIDSDGVYTAPNATGIDTVQVQDSLGAKVTQSILVGNALQLFCDVIQEGLGLDDGSVYLWDQKIIMPTDPGLFVVVGVLNAKPFGNSRIFGADGNDIQSVNMHTTLSLDIVSRGTEARDRKEEVIMALNSFYAEQQQEMNSFKIFPLSSTFVNLSEIDGAAIPYRFNITVNIQYFVQKTVSVPYFDQFTDEELIDD